MSELKSCPFCGGTGMYVTYQQSVYIRCRKCNSTSDDYKTTEEAENAWNKRPNPWHTGTPTEKGWYVLECSNGLEDYHMNKLELIYGNLYWRFRFIGNIIRWQKIEPYKERE